MNSIVDELVEYVDSSVEYEDMDTKILFFLERNIFDLNTYFELTNKNKTISIHNLV